MTDNHTIVAPRAASQRPGIAVGVGPACRSPRRPAAASGGCAAGAGRSDRLRADRAPDIVKALNAEASRVEAEALRHLSVEQLEASRPTAR